MSVDEASIPETTAIVIGGSIAGLLAAAALAPHFARVVVLDRDELPPESKKYRSGVPPHGYQFHGLSVGGRLAMEALLPPGFTDAAVAEGAPPVRHLRRNPVRHQVWLPAAPAVLDANPDRLPAPPAGGNHPPGDQEDRHCGVVGQHRGRGPGSHRRDRTRSALPGR